MDILVSAQENRDLWMIPISAAKENIYTYWNLQTSITMSVVFFPNELYANWVGKEKFEHGYKKPTELAEDLKVVRVYPVRYNR